MACLDCDDSITSIPSGPPGPTGPAGPTGPTGPAPVISGTSTTNLLIATGNKTFTTQAGCAWVQGQRLRAVDSTNNSNLMEGEVVSYVGTTLILNIDHTEGSGTLASWIISIAGAVGSTGATGTQGANGYDSFGITTAAAISLGANLYTIPLNGINSQWGIVGQIIYIETAGYYKITVVTTGTSFQVLDLLYAGNVAANMTSTSGLKVGPAGIRGIDGLTGGAGGAGATGPTGPQGPKYTFTQVIITTATATDTGTCSNIPSSTMVPIIASATSTANLYLTGHITLTADAAQDVEIQIKLNTLSVFSAFGDVWSTMTAVVAPNTRTYITIPISGIFAVTATDAITFSVDLSSYANNTSVTARLQYSYQ